MKARDSEHVRRAQEAQEAVIRRLRWAAANGRTEQQIAQSLGWATGAGTVLRELERDGRAFQRDDGVWLHSSHYTPPPPVGTGAPADLDELVLSHIAATGPVQIGDIAGTLGVLVSKVRASLVRLRHARRIESSGPNRCTVYTLSAPAPAEVPREGDDRPAVDDAAPPPSPPDPIGEAEDAASLVIEDDPPVVLDEEPPPIVVDPDASVRIDDLADPNVYAGLFDRKYVVAALRAPEPPALHPGILEDLQRIRGALISGLGSVRSLGPKAELADYLDAIHDDVQAMVQRLQAERYSRGQDAVERARRAHESDGPVDAWLEAIHPAARALLSGHDIEALRAAWSET